jgi:hypothetical protein
MELQLPASSFPYELLFYAINKCRLFIYCKGMVEYNIFNYNLFLKRQQAPRTNRNIKGEGMIILNGLY